MDREILATIRQADGARMRERLNALASDPLPYRKANWRRPGAAVSSLDEADALIRAWLAPLGYEILLEPCQAQAFRRDTTKPAHAQYSRPAPEDPWYTVHNLRAVRAGSRGCEESIWVIAHKDSQSWIDSPGANDNAIGTVGALEVAALLAEWQPRRTLCFLFCNEEHTPWSSRAAAAQARDRGDVIAGLFNLDGIGVHSVAERQAGRMTNVSAYTVDEGLATAQLMAAVNERYAVGLEQRIVRRERPGDDDGSFVQAGFGRAIINIGSWPYADPNYHLVTDKVDLVDVGNARLTVQATVAAVMELDATGC